MASNTCSFKYRKTNPNMIHIGDLVEVQISFVAFAGSKTRPGYIKPILRSIAVMDSSLREVCILFFFINVETYIL